MKIVEIYDRAVRRGIELDPRGVEQVGKSLARRKKVYEEADEKKKSYFDKESLSNPYSDTRILCGEADTEVATVIVGIDIEVGEVLLADRLRERGKNIDLIIAHHPEGRALAGLYEVMGMQSGILSKYGVPVNVAEGIMEGRIKEVERKLLPTNHARAVDAAKLLGIPMMCLHTPADNSVTEYLQRLLDGKRPDRVSDVMEILSEIEEYRSAVKEKAALKIVAGSGDRSAGKIFVDMTGGTGGSKDIFSRLSQAGVGTIVGMHIGEEHRKEAEKYHINVVIAGHIASDTLGMNLLFDNILGGISIVSCSGYHRFNRNNQ